jgi:hypothetical protein
VPTNGRSGTLRSFRIPSMPYFGPWKLLAISAGSCMSCSLRFFSAFRPKTFPAMLLKMFGMFAASNSSMGYAMVAVLFSILKTVAASFST